MKYRESALQEFVSYWIENIKSRSVKAATLKRLRGEAKALEAFPIAQMRLCDIRLFDIQEYVNQLVDAGYSLSTIKKQRLIVTAPMRYAYQTELVDRDYTSGVKLPVAESVLKTGKDVEAYTEEEQIKLREYSRKSSSVFGHLTVFLLETGLRIGEAQALCWSDIDWIRQTVRVHKTFLNGADDKNNVIQFSPKTRSSARIIPLSKTALEILQMLSTKKNGDFIFQRGGNPVSHGGMTKWLKKACVEENIPCRGIHALRHTFATNCYYKSCDIKILSKMLGHASTSITYNTYINLYGDGLEEMRRIVN